MVQVLPEIVQGDKRVPGLAGKPVPFRWRDLQGSVRGN
jgi:hypothetical protein